MTYALDDLIPGVTQRLEAERVHPDAYHKRTAPAVGIMLHYDGSLGADKWAVGWFVHPDCKVGYEILVLDDASVVLIHSDVEGLGSQHAGPCLPESHIPQGSMATPIGPLRYGRANGAYYAVSITTGPGVPATPKQFQMVINVCAAIYRYHMAHPTNRWEPGELSTRIVSHASRAIYTPKYTKDSKKWGKIGRKDDPEGPKLPGKPWPVMSTEGVIIATALLLTPAPGPDISSLDDPFNVFRPGIYLPGRVVSPSDR